MLRRGIQGRLSAYSAAIWSLLTLALVVRLLAVAAADTKHLGVDAGDYDRHARSIAAGHGYPRSLLAAGGGPSVLRLPAYPYFLAGIYKLSGDSRFTARVVQAILGVVAVALLGVVALQLFGRKAVLPALALGAIYPPWVLSSDNLLSEALFTPLELATLAAALRGRSSPHGYRWAVAAAVLCALASLTRPIGVLLLLAVVPAVLSSGAPGESLRRRLAPLAAALLAFVICLIPWTVRNAVEIHAFRPLGDETGVQLAGVFNDLSRHERALPAVWVPPSVVPMYADLFKRRDLTELQIESTARDRAVTYLGHHIGYVATIAYWHTRRILHLGGQRFEHLDNLENSYDFPLHETERYGFYVAFLLAIGGALTTLVRRAPRWLWLTPAAFLLSAVFSAGLIRYRFPLDPFLLLVGALAIAAALARAARVGSGPPGADAAPTAASS